MRNKIRNRWVAALRSGDYVQGVGRLTTPAEHDEVGRYARTERYEHCCLGVLCELAVQDGIAERFVHWDDVTGATVGYRAVGSDSWAESGWKFPPDVVVHWAGLTGDGNPVVQLASRPALVASVGAEARLAALNDIHGASFDVIADLVEASL